MKASSRAVEGQLGAEGGVEKPLVSSPPEQPPRSSTDMDARERRGTNERRGVAGRVLMAFLATTLAFAVTVAFSVYTQRRAAEDNEELAKGFVPVALRLARLRANQTTLATLLEGTPDDRDPRAMRQLVGPLSSQRQLTLGDARGAIEIDLVTAGSAETRLLARSFASDLAAVESLLASDQSSIDELFAALERGDRNAANEVALRVGTVEHDADKKIGALANRVTASLSLIHISEPTRPY